MEKKIDEIKTEHVKNIKSLDMKTPSITSKTFYIFLIA